MTPVRSSRRLCQFNRVARKRGRWWCESSASGCICGVPPITKARRSTYCPLGGWQIRGNPASTKPLDAARIRSRTLQRTPPDREFLLQTQAISGDRDALRQNRQEFPCRHPPRRRYDLAQLTTGPSTKIPNCRYVVESYAMYTRYGKQRAASPGGSDGCC